MKPEELQMFKRYYGKNYKKVIKESPLEVSKLRNEFLLKYPSAEVSRFEFNVSFNQNGSVGAREIFFKDPDEVISSYEITSGTFKNNPEWTQYLYWPKEWSESDKITPLSKPKTFDINPNILLIFVTEKKKFTTHFEPINTQYTNSSPGKNIRTELFDYINNPYFTAIAASYVSTYLCGISQQHLTNSIKRASSNIVTSIVQYHYSYHLRRFLKQPKKLNRYMTDDVVKLLQKHIPTNEKWGKRYSYSGAKLYLFKRELEKEGKIVRNLKFILHGNQGVSTVYDEFMWSHAKGADDYKSFIQKFSSGLTKLGQKLLQQSIESYVYCVLGAQARTRWDIVDQGAKSLQTQEVFVKLIGDTVVQDDVTTGISNMRKAIKSTNVILNFAISPGLILIPSDMRILINPVSGFNNTLTLATNKMMFGGNKDVNKLLVKPQNESETNPEISETNPEISTAKPQVSTVKPLPKIDVEPTYLSNKKEPKQNELTLPLVFGVSLASILIIFKKFF